MQIVIDIPYGLKDSFEHEREWTALLCADMREALRNGIPLPKGHGRLIDADALLDKKQDYGEGQQKLMLIDPYFIRKAPTIIEADKGGRT